eukprot:962522-Prymnesium_polylepis.2
MLHLQLICWPTGGCTQSSPAESGRHDHSKRSTPQDVCPFALTVHTACGSSASAEGHASSSSDESAPTLRVCPPSMMATNGSGVSATSTSAWPQLTGAAAMQPVICSVYRSPARSEAPTRLRDRLDWVAASSVRKPLVDAVSGVPGSLPIAVLFHWKTMLSVLASKQGGRVACALMPSEVVDLK